MSRGDRFINENFLRVIMITCLITFQLIISIRLGLEQEISTFKVIENIYLNAKTTSDREHLFNYKLSEDINAKNYTFDPIDSRIRRPELKFDLDSFEDFKNLSLGNYKMEMRAFEIIRKRDLYEKGNKCNNK